MRTFIMMWNPEISNIKDNDINELITECSKDFNWSIWDWEEVVDGDRFFLVRVKSGRTGIVMAGNISGEPYIAPDWSDKGRKVYYVDLDYQYIINDSYHPMISTQQLEKELPGFDWNGGHSGRVLSDDMAEKLEFMWYQYLYCNPSIFKDEDVLGVPLVNGEIGNELFDNYMLRHTKNKCEICGYDYKKVWGKGTVDYVPYRIMHDGKYDTTKNPDEFINHIHCLCDNCNNYVDEAAVRERLDEKPYEMTDSFTEHFIKDFDKIFGDGFDFDDFEDYDEDEDYDDDYDIDFSGREYRS